MAIDNTPPRLKLIVTIAVITVITLVCIDFALRSYYAYMTDDAQRSKLAPTTELATHHEQEGAAFTTAAMPLDQAMTQLAKGSRGDIVTPRPSDDLGPMTGWSKLPKPAPTPEPHAAGAPPAPGPSGNEPMNPGDAGMLGAPSHATDGGAGAHGDGGPGATGKDGGAGRPHDAPTKDAGAPKKGAPRK